MADRHTRTLLELRLRHWTQHRDTALHDGRYDDHNAACRTVNRLRREHSELVRDVGRMSKKDKATRQATIEACAIAERFPVFVAVSDATMHARAVSGVVVRHSGHWHVAFNTTEVAAIFGRRRR